MDIRGYVDVDVDVDVGGLDMPIIQSNPIHSEPYADATVSHVVS
jgi:hypothetical protein